MPRPIQATVSRSALAHNLAAARRYASKSKVWAVIKARGYGHGISRAVRGLADADGLALLDLDEAAKARARGWMKPILLLEGFFHAADLIDVAGLRLTPVIHCIEQVELLSRVNLDSQVDVYLKMNTGMNRLGFSPKDYRRVHDRLRTLPAVRSISLMTHFSDADGPRGVSEQLLVFDGAVQGMAGERSLANSAAVLRYPQSHAQWVRPGIILYGSSPYADQTAAQFGLRPAMALRSELIAVQPLRRGDTVGYGAAFAAPEPMRVGIVACGYADGYPRHAPAGTPVVVNGVRTRLVGRVSMDMLAVDLAPLPNAGVGTSVTLWGADGLSVDEVAQSAGTIGYELLCALSPRVPTTEAP
jgi:alanine racemase